MFHYPNKSSTSTNLTCGDYTIDMEYCIETEPCIHTVRNSQKMSHEEMDGVELYNLLQRHGISHPHFDVYKPTPNTEDGSSHRQSEHTPIVTEEVATPVPSPKDEQITQILDMMTNADQRMIMKNIISQYVHAIQKLYANEDPSKIHRLLTTSDEFKHMFEDLPIEVALCVRESFFNTEFEKVIQKMYGYIEKHNGMNRRQGRPPPFPLTSLEPNTPVQPMTSSHTMENKHNMYF